MLTFIMPKIRAAIAVMAILDTPWFGKTKPVMVNVIEHNVFTIVKILFFFRVALLAFTFC